MLRDIDVVVFDKTGTLTQGTFGVTDIHALNHEEELLRLTAAVETSSEHIIARAITEHAREQDIDFSQATEFRAIPGKGAYGELDGKEIHVGSPKLLRDLGIEYNDEAIERLQGEGKTVVYTVVDGELAGYFGLSDQIRDESREAVSKLKDLGYTVYMITGDSEDAARWVAQELGIDDYFAEVLPDKKAEEIKRLKDQGRRVAMVGDGINDAPALVTADVGIAIGAGTDVAIESADITLVQNDPGDVAEAIDLSQKTYSKMVQNLWWAAGYNVLAIPLAAGVLSSIGVVLNPAVGALAMSLSTVIVAVNSQTLRRYEPETME
jgi:Cu2+-exporting ATPase